MNAMIFHFFPSPPSSSPPRLNFFALQLLIPPSLNYCLHPGWLACSKEGNAEKGRQEKKLQLGNENT
jgi:hypothetical protein